MIRATVWALVVTLAGSVSPFTTVPSSAVEAPAQIRNLEWWIKRWGLEEVWATTRGRGVVVAVIDSGVQASLSVLRGAVLPGVVLSGNSADGRDTDPDSHGTV